MNPFKPAPSCSDLDEYGSLRAEDAMQMILDHITPVSGAEMLPTLEAAGRVLGEDIVSGSNVPAHTNSAVDGYALRCSDWLETDGGLELQVIDTAFAGQAASSVLKPGTAIRIMTGAVLPEGADAVCMQERVEVLANSIKLHFQPKPGDNIRQAGEDMRAGETVLPRGRLLTPADIGLIASLGFAEVKVRRAVRVALISTGDEVKSIGTPLVEGNVFDSNRYSLYSALRQLSVQVSNYGIVPDDQERLAEIIASAQSDHDLVITTGGVSVGDADHTRLILESMGEILFSKVAIKPGRPLTFACAGSKAFFGLPGNPVAVMVTYYQFVWRALRKMMGIDPDFPLLRVKARTLNRIRKKPGRTEYQRGILEQNVPGEWVVRSTGRQGSGILRSMSLANAFIVLPHDAKGVEVGEEVEVQPFAAFR